MHNFGFTTTQIMLETLLLSRDLLLIRICPGGEAGVEPATSGL